MATSIKYVDVEDYELISYGSSWTVQCTWKIDYASSSRSIGGELGRGWQNCTITWYGYTETIDDDGKYRLRDIVIEETKFTDQDGVYENGWLKYESTIQPPGDYASIYPVIRIRSERNATQTWDDNHHLLQMMTYVGDSVLYSDWAEIHPPKPSEPSILLADDGVNVSLGYRNVDENVYGARFKVYRKDSSNDTAYKLQNEYTVKRATDGSITWTNTLSRGYMYAFCASFLGNYGTSSKPKIVEGETSDVTEWITTAPINDCIRVSSFKVTAVQQSEVNLTWQVYSKQDKLDGIKVQYAKTKAELEAESGASFNEVEYDIVVTKNNKGNVRISGLEIGATWYFRIRGFINTNGTKYYANWYSNNLNGKYTAVSVTLGTTPDAPTTWTLQQTFAYEDNTSSGFYVYAIHNSEDGSACESFKLYADVYDENGVYLRHLINGRVIANGKDQYGNYLTDNLSYKIRPYYEHSTRNYFDQKEIHWWIQTKGAMPDYSPSSLVRVVKLYKQPSANVSVYSGSYGYPITIYMNLDSAHQNALVYYLEITSNSSYTYTDAIGEEHTVLPGDIMLSATYNAASSESSSKSIQLASTDISLVKNKSYTATVTIYTSGGLIATDSTSFTFSYSTTHNIYPSITEFEVDNDRSIYLRCICYKTPGRSASQVWVGSLVVMSLYRYNSDGTYTLVKDNIITNSSLGTWVHDPHPRLDYQIYRLVGTYVSTGETGYTDPDFVIDVINGEGVIIHWDEKWGYAFANRVSGPQISRYIGKRLRLPFNVDVTEKRAVDKTLINYAGRESPVSYYGTAIDKSYSIKTEIPKHNVNEFNSDEAMLLLRQLSIKKEDVYVRTCTGIGCWATVDIEYNIDHCALTIPITITVTPVEGGA